MKYYGINPGPECPIFSEYVADFAALENIRIPSAYSVLLLAADTLDIHTDTIARVAKRLIAEGIIYVCTWGPDCERVHDICDEIYVGDEAKGQKFILISTWHDDETLEDAIWFFINSAFPTDDEIGTTSYLAVTVADKRWAATVDGVLSDLARLYRVRDLPSSNIPSVKAAKPLK